MNRVHFGTLTNQTLEFKLILYPKLFKDLHATLGGYTRIKPIKRTRKRQIAKAKHMMAWHAHTSYEWSQWWHKTARKPKRWSK